MIHLYRISISKIKIYFDHEDYEDYDDDEVYDDDNCDDEDDGDDHYHQKIY
jgi:hypothetical protein